MKIARKAVSRKHFLLSLEKELGIAGIDEAREESERILEEMLELDRTSLHLDSGKKMTEEAAERSLKILEGRKKRMPLAYLLGKAHFRNEELFVNENVLIPRPETETLIECVLKEFQHKDRDFSFLDIGTGSGAIAVSILREYQNACGTLLDLSDEALGVAGINVERYQLADRARLVYGDLFFAVDPEEKWDLIVSNPPYLSEDDFKELQPELAFEPRAALAGGKDGLDFYRRIIPEAMKHLNPGGFLALEVGMGQAGQVSTWLQEAGYDNIQRFHDLLHIERVVTARMPDAGKQIIATSDIHHPKEF